MLSALHEPRYPHRLSLSHVFRVSLTDIATPPVASPGKILNVNFRRRPSRKLQALHAQTRNRLFQFLVCRMPARSLESSFPGRRVEPLDRCARPAQHLLLSSDKPSNPDAAPHEDSAARLSRRRLLNPAGWYWWPEQSEGAAESVVQQAQQKLLSADFCSADQLMQKWLSDTFGSGSVAVLNCSQWLMLARLAFLRDDLHGGLLFLDRAAAARQSAEQQSAEDDSRRRCQTHELLLRAAAASMSGCPELSAIHLRSAECVGLTDDPAELQLTMLCRALVDLANHRSQSANRLFQASLLLRQESASASAGALLNMQHELVESLQLLAEIQPATPAS